MFILTCCHLVETAFCCTPNKQIELLPWWKVQILQEFKSNPFKIGWDVSGNIIWANEHFPEKVFDVAHNEYQGSDDVIDIEKFNESEFGWEGASDDCALNKGFRKFV